MHHYQKHIGDYRRDTTHLSMLEHGAYNQLLDWAYLDEKPIPRKTDLVFRRLRAVTDDEKKAVLTVLEEFFEETEEGFRHKRVEAELRLYEEKAERARKNGQKGGRPPSPDAGGDESSSLPVGNGISGNSMTYADDRNRTSGVNSEKLTDNRLGFSGLSPETQTKTNHEPLTINQEPITKDKKQERASDRPGDDDPTALFDRFWEAYPRKTAKKDAQRAFEKLALTPNDPRVEAIREGLRKAKKSRAWLDGDGKFIPHAATWLNGERWRDDHAEPPSGGSGARASPPRPSGRLGDFSKDSIGVGEDGRIVVG